MTKVATVCRDMLLIWNRSKLMLELSMSERNEMWMYAARLIIASPIADILMLRMAGREVQMSLMMIFLEL